MWSLTSVTLQGVDGVDCRRVGWQSHLELSNHISELVIVEWYSDDEGRGQLC